jgi:hypothetical protein
MRKSSPVVLVVSTDHRLIAADHRLIAADHIR